MSSWAEGMTNLTLSLLRQDLSHAWAMTPVPSRFQKTCICGHVFGLYVSGISVPSKNFIREMKFLRVDEIYMYEYSSICYRFLNRFLLPNASAAKLICLLRLGNHTDFMHALASNDLSSVLERIHVCIQNLHWLKHDCFLTLQIEWSCRPTMPSEVLPRALAVPKSPPSNPAERYDKSSGAEQPAQQPRGGKMKR